MVLLNMILKKKLFIIEECDINVIHDTSNFEEFYESYINNDIKKYDMTITKFKKFYVRLLFKSNQVIDANNIIHLYRQNFNIPLNLTKTKYQKKKQKP